MPPRAFLSISASTRADGSRAQAKAVADGSATQGQVTPRSRADEYSVDGHHDVALVRYAPQVDLRYPAPIRPALIDLAAPQNDVGAPSEKVYDVIVAVRLSNRLGHTADRLRHADLDPVQFHEAGIPQTQMRAAWPD
jgi:hypothetical protein